MSNRHLNHYFGKTYVFYYWQMLIIFFAGDRAKKYGLTPLCELGKGKFTSGAADFGMAGQHGVVMAFITDRNY